MASGVPVSSTRPSTMTVTSSRHREHHVHVVFHQQHRVVAPPVPAAALRPARFPPPPDRPAARRAAGPRGPVARTKAISSKRRCPWLKVPAQSHRRMPQARPVATRRARACIVSRSSPAAVRNSRQPRTALCAARRAFSSTRHRRKQFGPLKAPADPGACAPPVRQRGHIGAVQQDRSLIRPDRAAEQIDQGAFARRRSARSPRAASPGRSVERNIRDRDQAAEPPAQTARLQRALIAAIRPGRDAATARGENDHALRPDAAAR